MLKIPGCHNLELDMLEPEWKNMSADVPSDQLLTGRCRHTSVKYEDKIVSFGGCFMFDKKRQVRECTNQVTVFDTEEKTMTSLKTRGLNVLPRKDHCAAAFGASMVVFGGQLESGHFCNELLNLDLEHNDWGRLYPKQTVEPFVQATCCSIVGDRKAVEKEYGGGLQRLVSTLF